MIFMTGIFFSCVNDLNKVKKITTHPDNPDETSEMLHVIYTDSGFAQIEIYANIAETYAQPKNVTKFKDGLKVNFYNEEGDRKSTRLNSSHVRISYAVFCLKKKNKYD